MQISQELLYHFKKTHQIRIHSDPPPRSLLRSGFYTKREGTLERIKKRPSGQRASFCNYSPLDPSPTALWPTCRLLLWQRAPGQSRTPLASVLAKSDRRKQPSGTAVPSTSGFACFCPGFSFLPPAENREARIQTATGVGRQGRGGEGRGVLASSRLWPSPPLHIAGRPGSGGEAGRDAAAASQPQRLLDLGVAESVDDGVEERVAGGRQGQGVGVDGRVGGVGH